MAYTPKAQSEQKKDRFQLAIPVQERVEIGTSSSLLVKLDGLPHSRSRATRLTSPTACRIWDRQERKI